MKALLIKKHWVGSRSGNNPWPWAGSRSGANSWSESKSGYWGISRSWSRAFSMGSRSKSKDFSSAIAKTILGYNSWVANK